MQLVAGIFVGGRGSRMGGVAKGWLRAPDGAPIAVRTRGLLEDAGAACVLVGAGAGYEPLGLPALADDPGSAGPLAGLLALLAHAGDRPALAVACDMPLLDAAIVRRLVLAPRAPVVAPRRGGRWEPLFARYDARAVLPVARALAAEGVTKLQRLLDAAGAAPLPLSADEERLLTDWDRPEDVLRAPARRGTRSG